MGRIKLVSNTLCKDNFDKHVNVVRQFGDRIRVYVSAVVGECLRDSRNVSLFTVGTT